MQSVKDAHSNLPTFYKQMWPLGMCILHSIAGWYIGSSSILVYIPCNMHFFKYQCVAETVSASIQWPRRSQYCEGTSINCRSSSALLSIEPSFPFDAHTTRPHLHFLFFIVSSHLCQKNAEIFERLQQTGVSDFLYNKDTFGWLVPCQPLTGWILYMPE